MEGAEVRAWLSVRTSAAMKPSALLWYRIDSLRVFEHTAVSSATSSGILCKGRVQYQYVYVQVKVLAGKDTQRSFGRESTRVEGRPSHRNVCEQLRWRQRSPLVWRHSGRRSFAEPARNTGAWAAESRALMSALPTWKGKKRRAGSKKGKKGQKGKKRRKTTKSSTRRKPSYEDGETAPFWNKELEEVYAQLPMPAMAQGASTAADLASGCSSHDGRKWSTWCSRRIVENESLEPGVRARAEQLTGGVTWHFLRG